jgi:heat induced stress protein YflT
MSTPNEETNVTVAVFPSHQDAERAVMELQRAGFDMKRLSIVGADYHTEEHVIGYYNTGDRMRAWGRAGAFWGGIWGLLFGAAFFMVPGVGPVLVAGPLVAAIIAGLESSVIVGGLSALGAGLVSLGVPKNSVLDYESAIRAGKYLLVAHGAEAEVNRAREILTTAHAESTR